MPPHISSFNHYLQMRIVLEVLGLIRYTINERCLTEPCRQRQLYYVTMLDGNSSSSSISIIFHEIIVLGDPKHSHKRKTRNPIFYSVIVSQQEIINHRSAPTTFTRHKGNRKSVFGSSMPFSGALKKFITTDRFCFFTKIVFTRQHLR